MGMPFLQPKACWNSSMLATVLLTRYLAKDWGLVSTRVGLAGDIEIPDAASAPVNLVGRDGLAANHIP